MTQESGENRILVLDDELPVLEVVQEQLQEGGYVCDIRQDLDEALADLRTGNFTVLITDIRMPGCDGIEVARQVKQEMPDISVIVMTGISDVNLAIQANRAGADDYILKPFSADELMLSVQRTLEKQGLIRQAQLHKQELEHRVEDATSQLRETNEVLVRTQQYLNNLLESTVDAIITFGEDSAVTFANRGAQQMLGYAENELNGRSMNDLCTGGIEEVQYLRRVLSPESPLQNYETELKRKDGEMVPASMSLSLVCGAEGEVESLLAVCKDITEQKRLEQELKEKSIRDGLTGLYNLRHFYERLEMEVERAKRQGYQLSLLLLDVDRFKGYNDSHGHLEGDQVLKGVAQCIKDCTREHVDVGFRYGGDEFTVIIPEAPKEQVLLIANRIREMFVAKRYDLLTLSIGLMTYDERYSTRNFIQLTDSMMYDAKRSGGNRVYVYDAAELESVAEATKTPTD